jgi:tetratricopeptide (TPR) repeat protein
VHLDAALSLVRQMKDGEKVATAIFRHTVLEAHQGHYQAGLELAKQGLRYARATKARFVEGQLLKTMGNLYARLEQPQEAIRWVEQSMQVFRELGEQYQLWLALGNLYLPYVQLGMWEDFVRITEETTTYYEASGGRNNAERSRGDTAIGYFMLGNRKKARQVIQDVLGRIDPASTQRLGTAKNNLALVLEADQEYESAEQQFKEAMGLFEVSKSTAHLAFAQNALGAMYVKINRPQDAISLLQFAHDYFQKGGLFLQLLFNEAYQGLAYLGIGERTQAETLAQEGWRAFKDGVRFGQSYLQWLWALYRLLTALGQESSVNELIYAAYADLQRQAQTIHDPENRRGFLENVHTNRFIVEAYDRINQITRVVDVSLAQQNAPLGRLLREDEFIPVRWTVNAPEDEAISDKTVRRQHQLKRLLQQAESQHGAPTDEDLAQALGVSRRTILRDMQALAKEIPRLPTRKRKV